MDAATDFRSPPRLRALLRAPASLLAAWFFALGAAKHRSAALELEADAGRNR